MLIPPFVKRRWAREVLSISALATAVGCGGSSGAGPDAGAPAPADPIVQRPSRDTYACAIQRGRTDHSPRQWRLSQGLAPAGASSAFVARLEALADPTAGIAFGAPSLVVSTLDLAGNFGSALSLPGTKATEAGDLTLVPRSDGGAALLWLDGSRLRFTAFGSSGDVIVPSKDLPADDIDAVSPVIAAAGKDGTVGILYVVGSGSASPPRPRAVHFLALSADGVPLAAARQVVPISLAYATPPMALAVTAGGEYGILVGEGSGSTSRMSFVSVSAAADTMSAPRTIAMARGDGIEVGVSSGFTAASATLAEFPNGYLAAWGESKPSTDKGAWAAVRIVRLDATGTPQGEAAYLRAPTGDFDEVEPTIFPYEGKAAVMWARGSHIYVCAGCIPNHRIDFLLLDPTDLTPLSSLVTIDNGGGATAGGLRGSRALVRDQSILVTYDLTFHVHSTAGSAVFGCTKK